MKFEGTWYNEIGSQMNLQCVGKNISGTYHTSVGNASGIYNLSGQMDTDLDQSTAIGWVVVWNNEYGSSDSITAWSGQVQTVDGVLYIVTTWLLTSETEQDDNWHSTFIGKDIFTKTQPSEEERRKNISKGMKQSSPMIT